MVLQSDAAIALTTIEAEGHPDGNEGYVGGATVVRA